MRQEEMLMKQILSLSTYLAVKEIWRNRARFLLVSLVIALITLLVLFIAALGEGLGNGNREYISKLDAQLIVYQAKSDFVIQSSRLGRDRLAAIRRVEGVAGCRHARHRQRHPDPGRQSRSAQGGPAGCGARAHRRAAGACRAASSARTWRKK